MTESALSATALPSMHGPSAHDITPSLDRHRAACLLAARRVLCDRHLAEDAVQDAFLDAWQLADRFDPARASELRWLLTLTHRRAVDRVRKEQRHGPTLPPDAFTAISGPVDPQDHAVTADRAHRLRRGLSCLSAEQHEVLVLAYFGGYTQREITGLTGLPLGTVKTRTLAGMRRLKATLRNNELTLD